MFQGCKHPSCSTLVPSQTLSPAPLLPILQAPMPASWLRHTMSAAAVSRGGYRCPCWHHPNPAGKLMGIGRFACRNSNGICALERHSGSPGEAECTQDSCRDNTALPSAGEQVPGSSQLSFPDGQFQETLPHLCMHPEVAQLAEA